MLIIYANITLETNAKTKNIMKLNMNKKII